MLFRSKALDYAGLTGRETVLDLYCGIGTITLCLDVYKRQAHGLVFVGHGLDLVHDGVDGFQLPGAVITENLFHQTHDCDTSFPGRSLRPAGMAERWRKAR